VDVSEFGSDGIKVTQSLDLLPSPSSLFRNQKRHQYSTQRLSAFPGAISVDISAREASLESEEPRLKLSGKRAIVQREAKARYNSQRLRQFDRSKRIRPTHFPKHKEKVDESRPDSLYDFSDNDAITRRAIASLRKQYEDVDDGMSHSLAMEKIILEHIFHKFIEEYTKEKRRGIQRKYIHELLLESSNASSSEHTSRSQDTEHGVDE
jgi:hypothetical protein